MAYLYYLLIYLLLAVTLIGCQPPETCYEDVVEKSRNETPGGWFRMSEVRPDNDVNSIMLSAVKRLNRDKDDDRIYQVDRDEKGIVADLEMFEQVKRSGINFCVKYGVKSVGCKGEDDTGCQEEEEESPTKRVCVSYAHRSSRDDSPKLALIDGVVCD